MPAFVGKVEIEPAASTKPLTLEALNAQKKTFIFIKNSVLKL